MSQALQLDPPLTIEGFDAFLAHQAEDRLWELVDGRLVAMTNPTTVHEQIVSNIGVRLKLAADERCCQAFFGGMRVQRSDSAQGIDKPKPDLLVRCGTMPRAGFVTDPVAVVEVLSPSTIDVDRGDKLRFYKTLPTLLDIVLVYQDQIRIETYRRDDRGWSFTTLSRPDDLLAFEGLPFEMTLRNAYFGVTLDA